MLTLGNRSVWQIVRVIPRSSPDPGWGRARDIVLALVPSPTPYAIRRRHENGLVALRTTFVAFATALFGVGAVALFLASGPDPESALDPLTGTITAGVVGAVQVTLSWTLRGRLACDSPDALAASYRSRFLLRIALANAAALTGFVFVNLTGSAMPYAVGLAWATAGFGRVAPTAGNLERCQIELGLRGCPHRLVDVLQGSVPAR
ncbi:MAG TPA: hypothetical protein VFP06_12135 [Acidimicrobiales bacterium]|nr:hypothetical protein [Acidimicrobiales bacterium]